MSTVWRTPVAGVVLAAGRGSRLAPLTRELPKPLCPVANRALLDHALDRLVEACGGDPAGLAVNLHHGAAAIAAHLERSGEDTRSSGPWGRVYRSHERERALGTAGALAHLRGWLDGRAALVVNADAWTTVSPAALADGWDGQRPRVLVVGSDFGPGASVAAALVPAALVAALPAAPSGLYEQIWGPHHAAGTLEVVVVEGSFIDCGTPARYLEANLAASGGRSVVDPTATVVGGVKRCVVWAGARVEGSEQLVGAVRTTAGQTVLVR